MLATIGSKKYFDEQSCELCFTLQYLKPDSNPRGLSRGNKPMLYSSNLKYKDKATANQNVD
uniref:Putative ovule protein n=1 Tax=Solanum chacoense TaxID=4108 RepID=A0A0V0GF47_SOLCH